MTPSQRAALERARRDVGEVRARILNEFGVRTVSHTPLGRDGALTDFDVIGLQDRYGFPVRTAICRRTGLIFLLDRLGEHEYGEFYRHGSYRELLKAFRNSQVDEPTREERRRAKARKKAAGMVDALRGVVKFPAGVRMLDVGGSSGEASVAFRDAYGMLPTVLDPAEEELAGARDEGLQTQLGDLESVEFASDQKYDVVLVHRTIEHIYDMRIAIERIRALLPPDGLFIFDFLDFLSAVEKLGCVEAASRLDHCHFFYLEMLESFLAIVGFRAFITLNLSGGDFLCVCGAAEPNPRARLSDDTRMRLLRQFAGSRAKFLLQPLDGE